MASERSVAASQTGTAYERVAGLIDAGRCVVLDGGIGTELPSSLRARSAQEERLWGTRALVDAAGRGARRAPPLRRAGLRRDLDEHLGAAERAAGRRAAAAGSPPGPCTGWTSPGAACASRAARSARRTATPSARSRSRSTATSTAPRARRRSGCSRALFADEPPDLILLETLSLVRPSLFRTIEALLATGLPVWVSFRRCRHGLCGVYGQHWGGPEGDAFGRAARRFEEMGVGALLVNCIPPDHVDGMVVLSAGFHRPAVRRVSEPRVFHE